MNRQPYARPPRSWPPKPWPLFVRLWRPFRRRALLTGQRIEKVQLEGVEHLTNAVAKNYGILITPNHSTHYDSFCLYESTDIIKRPFVMLTAWQVFAMSKPMEVWSMQRHGCFSIDRESNDLTAFKTAVEALQSSPYPLVIFPEGDIYHTNDRVMPFREGAAAIALSAAKRGERPIVAIPCAIKFKYVTDPLPELLKLMDRLERRLFWTPRPELPLVDRIYRFAEGILSLQEVECLGRPGSGEISTRIRTLISAILDRISHECKISCEGSPPERVKELRKHLIVKREQPDLSADEIRTIDRNMAHLFLAVQLFSYPGNYVRANPTIERVAETLDKFEEDVLETEYPSIRGIRRVIVRFGEPISVEREKGKRDQAGELSLRLEKAVQGLLDDINREWPSPILREASSV